MLNEFSKASDAKIANSTIFCKAMGERILTS